MTQEDINKKIKTLLEELNNGLYEKERSIRLTLLAVLAGESTFMLGEPGTAKSLIARRISEAFEDTENEDEIKFFDYLMNQFSTPEEIFGPVSINELKKDRYIRKTEKYLPKAQFAFLDEIWKANPAIQNTLLTILNEKIFRNGVQVEKVPLIGFMSASNELPAKDKGLDAIFDRFLVRILEKPIADNDNFRSMISAKRNIETKITKKLTKSISDTILKESENIKISDECFKIIDSVRKNLVKRNEEIKEENEKYHISDRRWKKIANLMRVSAYCNNRKETDLMDATLIADCIWSTEQQEEDAKRIINEVLVTFLMKDNTNYQNCISLIDQFKEQVDIKFFKEIGGDFKTKEIHNDTYRLVNDDKGNEYYISVKKDRYSPWNFNLWNNIETESIRGRWDDTKGIFIRECVNLNPSQILLSTKYNITYTIIRTPIELVHNSLFDNQEKCELIIQEFNKTYFNPLKERITNEIKLINSKINLCQNFENNLFTDTFFYLAEITTKLLNSANKLKQLLVKLDEQKKRYDESE